MSDVVTLGRVRIGPIDLAIPAVLIEEVVRGPVELTPFPAAPLHVLGAFALRGHPLPMVDVAALVRPAAAPEPLRPVAFAVVIRHASGRFALQVDEVSELVRAAPERITRLEGREPSGLFSQLYTPAGEGRVSVVLDLDALLSVSGLRSAVHASTESSPRAASAGVQGRAHVEVRLGSVRLALDAEHVHRIGPRPGVLDSPIAHPFMPGFHSVDGRMLPVFNLAAFLGLPAPPDSAAEKPWLIYAQGAWRGVFLVDEVISMERVQSDALTSPAESMSSRPDLLIGGFLDRSGQLTWVLHETRLLRELGLDGELTRAGATKSLDDRAGVASAEVEAGRFVVFRAGGRWFATPVQELIAVTTLPDDFLELRTKGGAQIGVCIHHGRSTAVLDLAVLLDALPLGRAAGMHLLCVTHRGVHHGFVIETLGPLVRAVPQPLPSRDRASHGIVPPFTSMIRIQAGGADRAACVLSLLDLSQRLSPSEQAA